jgi:hypothetical protein
MRFFNYSSEVAQLHRVRDTAAVARYPSGTADSSDVSAPTVTIKPHGVPVSIEPIEPRDPDRPPAHPGVVKLTARASSPAGVRKLRFETQMVSAQQHLPAAARDSLDVYVSPAARSTTSRCWRPTARTTAPSNSGTSP